LWELNRWMPGKANYHDLPSAARLTNALSALAQFHRSTAEFESDSRPSSNIRARLAQLRNIPQMIDAIHGAQILEASPTMLEFRRLAFAVIPGKTRGLISALVPFGHQRLNVQPVIRDVWHDHVFFEGDKVTGLVDFGAMQMDTVCLDIARLVGSLVGDNQDQFYAAIEAYSRIRPLDRLERQLISHLDLSGILLGSLNWLDWLLVRRRKFEDMVAVEQRVQWLAQRLSAMIE
jgi:homoserine kinase type II